MVSEKCLTQQAKRLLRLPFAPSDPEEATGLVKEFQRVLRGRVLTDAHCAAVVDHLMANSMRCPPPAEVLAAADTVEAPDAVKAPMGCATCTGSGFRQMVRRVHTAAGDYEAECAAFCTCELGEFKRAAEARRKAVELEKARARA